jgi:hypothetical protein
MLKHISILAAILVIAFSLNSVVLAQQENQKPAKAPKTEVKKEVSNVQAQSKVNVEKKTEATKKTEVKKTEKEATQKEEMKKAENEKAPTVKKTHHPKMKSETKETSTNPKK